MSGAGTRGRPAALPAALPLDLVEGRAAWPELDPVELEHLLDRADGLCAGLDDEARARVTAAVVGAAAAARLALDGRLAPERADELVAWAAAEGATTEAEARSAMFARTLLDVVAASPSPQRTADALLHALAAFGPAAGVRVEGPGPLPFARSDDVGADAVAVAIPDTDAVLLVDALPGAETRCRALGEEVARILRSTGRFRRTAGPDELARLAAAERRLRRLALDLHDGPAQDVAALASDAALLEADLREELSPERLDGARELADDIRLRLSALGRDIRDLAEVLEPRAILRAPLRDVLAREAAAFARRTGIEPTLEVDEDLGVMTASQQIALARVAREALTNVRDHAAATAVRLEATVTSDGVALVVTDNGRGFDVDAQTAGEGLGLAGMHERVRLLGGRLSIESRPGGPTRVAAVIPRWRPSA